MKNKKIKKLIKFTPKILNILRATLVAWHIDKFLMVLHPKNQNLGSLNFGGVWRPENPLGNPFGNPSRNPYFHNLKSSFISILSKWLMEWVSNGKSKW